MTSKALVFSVNYIKYLILNFFMKIHLRELKHGDEEALREVMNDEDVIYKMDDDRIIFPFDLQQAKNYIDKSIGNKFRHEFVIEDKKKNFIGTVSFDLTDKKNSSYEVSYFIGKEFWGKGIGSKALHEALLKGFFSLGARKIWANVLSNNEASQRLLEKAGFEFTKKLEKYTYRWQDGRYYDDYFFVLTREEFMRLYYGEEVAGHREAEGV